MVIWLRFFGGVLNSGTCFGMGRVSVECVYVVGVLL